MDEIAAVILALLLNLLIMRNADRIGKFLVRQNMLMPLIRITALIVAAIGLQMILNGIETFVFAIKDKESFAPETGPVGRTYRNIW